MLRGPQASASLRPVAGPNFDQPTQVIVQPLRRRQADCFLRIAARDIELPQVVMDACEAEQKRVVSGLKLTGLFEPGCRGG